MFSTFIDESIQKITEGSVGETPFELRMRHLRERFGESLVRTPTYEKTTLIETTDAILTSRLKRADVMVTPPKILKGVTAQPGRQSSTG